MPITRSCSDSTQLGNTEIKKLEQTMKTLLQDQGRKLDRACRTNNLNIDKNCKSMSKLNDLMLGLSVQITKLIFNGNNIPRSSSEPHEPEPPPKHSQYSARLTKVEFPKFNGLDLKSWIFKCKKFFNLDSVKDPDRVKRAAIHLEDKALLWHQTYIQRKNHILPIWEDYVKDIIARFGDLYDDPMEELKSLKQTGSVQEYHDSFDALASRLELSEPYLLSCYLAGLEEEVQLAVRMFNPTTLQQALCLAKLQEAAGKAKKPKQPTPLQKQPPLLPTPPPTLRTATQTFGTNNQIQPYTPNRPFTNPATTSKTRNTNRRTLTPAEFNDKRAKNQCFWCDESGNTHNFIDANKALKLDCKVESITPLWVKVADGNQLKCEQIIHGFKWKMQGIEFSADVFLLPLRGSDLVLGIQWFSQLDPVLWDFGKLTMEFKYGGKKVKLRGSSPKSWKIVQPHKLQKLLAQEGTLSMMQILPGSVEYSPVSLQTTAQDPTLFSLLDQFEVVFQPIQGLPPPREGFDHVIPLKEGTDALNLRAYKAADALSRILGYKLNVMAISSVHSELMDQIKQCWKEEESLQKIISELQQNAHSHKHFSWDNLCLKRKGKLVLGASPALRERILKWLHDSPQGGHSRTEATYQRVKSLFYWKGMKGDIRSYVRKCGVCQRLAQAYLGHIFKLHGFPKSIISDRDKVFISLFWSEFMKLQGVQHRMSTTYHPQTDGQSEVLNRCLETYLRCMCFEKPSEWSKWLSLAEFWYNTNYHTTSKKTPFEILYNIAPPLHRPYILGSCMVDTVD
uniref:Integrase catalytic domain-containing protein n=1 Tax=Chenopodium quinoa TaxID=63459 RepID=A0A803MT80_CHEQI